MARAISDRTGLGCAGGSPVFFFQSVKERPSLSFSRVLLMLQSPLEGSRYLCSFYFIPAFDERALRSNPTDYTTRRVNTLKKNIYIPSHLLFLLINRVCAYKDVHTHTQIHFINSPAAVAAEVLHGTW